MKLSFVIPVYDERDTLEALFEGIVANAPDADLEVIFIDDGSTDGSTEILRKLDEADERVRLIELDGNCGKSIALAAGFAEASGDSVFTMDSDLQDDPIEIPNFIAKLDEGFDVVCGWKAIRHDPWHKTIPSRFYNWGVSKVFNLPLHDVNCGYKLLRRNVIDNTTIYGELHRLIPVLAHDRGFRIGEIVVKHKPREFGQSKFGLERFSRGALDVLTMWMLHTRMRAPGHFFGKIAFVEFLGATVCSAIAIYFASDGHFGASAALASTAAILAGTGIAVFSLGITLEHMLKHFIRIDPQHFAKDSRKE
jgi:glycosyltransferase involved in cell wall biosynthesis